jgi:hypothetical protein
MGPKYPTLDSSPSSPNPLAPPGAGEPNSHIWPTFRIEAVHAEWPVTAKPDTDLVIA